MSMDMYDIEWICGCGATNPDYDDQCRMCGTPRYLDDEDDMSSINDNESPSYRDSMNDAERGHLLG